MRTMRKLSDFQPAMGTLRPMIGGAWALALGVISIRIWIKPNSHSVFTSFREAGAHWTQASDLYGHGSKFLYSPLAAAIFAPFSLLPENVAGIIWRLIGGIALFLATLTAAQTVWPAPAVRKWWWSLLALLPLSLTNLNNGQANPLVLALLLFSIVALLKEQWFFCALCLAVSAYFKIYPLALGLVLSTLFPKKLSWRLFLSVIAMFGISLLLQHRGYVLSQYSNWFDHLGGITRRSADESRAWRDAYLLLRLSRIPVTPRSWIGIEVLAGLSVGAFCLWGYYRKWQAERLIFAVFALVCAWMVLFGPATEAASYILIGPALIYGLFQSYRIQAAAWIRAGMTVSYLGLLLAEISDSWLRLKGQMVYARAFQPAVATIFLATLIAWLAADAHWIRKENNQGKSKHV